MAETLAALLLAHALADFVLQTDWIVTNKRRPEGLALHGLVVLLTAAACTGTLSWGLVWLAALHLAIDAWKARAPRGLAIRRVSASGQCLPAAQRCSICCRCARHNARRRKIRRRQDALGA